MATCTTCKKGIASGYTSLHSDAWWEQEVLDSGDATGAVSTKDYPVCADCYKAEWKEVYPQEPCPI